MDVEALKRSRRPVQREIKKLSDEVTPLLAKNPPTEEDLESVDRIQGLMEAEYAKLLGLNAKIAEQMAIDKATDDDVDKEFDDVRQVKTEYLKVVSKIEKFFKKHMKPPSPTPSPSGSGVSSHITKNAGFKLPKIEIPVFSGEHKDWLGWWATFSRIDDNDGLDDADKFTYLKQAIRSNTRAKDLVDRYPASAANYPLAIQALKERYADKGILIDVYIRELQNLMMENAVSRFRGSEKVDLTTLFDRMETNMNALKTLGPIDQSHFLYPMIESCLPVSVIRAWQRSPLNKEDPSQQKTKLERLMEFLAAEVQGETRIALATKGYQAKEDLKKSEKNSKDVFRKNKNKKDDLPTAMGLVSLDGSEKCIFCEKKHPSTSCFIAPKMPLAERKERIKRTGRCLKCVKSRHLARDCQERVLCSTCGGPHVKVLCPGKEATANNNAVAPPVVQNRSPTFPAYQVANPSAGQVPVPTQFSMSNFNASPDVLLPTLMVGVQDAQGRVHKVRAAIDTMSGHTYITKYKVADLKISPYTTETFRHAVFGGATQVVEHYKYNVMLVAYNGEFMINVDVYDQDQIASGIPSVPSRGVFEELLKKGIILSDHPSQRSQPIELLIGGDVAGHILTGNSIKLQCGPLAMQTKFGWTVIGQTVATPQKKTSAYVEHSLANLHSPEDMWKLEAIGITDPATKLSRAEEDAIATERFAKTVRRNSDGRYEVALPWIEGHPSLPSNKAVAQRRLASATNKLKKQQKYTDYEEIFEEWLASGIIEEVDFEKEKDVHYLPHRAVIKEESATTKVRPVFDASCKKDEEPSLNDCLVTGPNLLEKIPNMLLKFREDRVAAIADIRKAFLMIEVKKEDRDFLRFLWWKSPDCKEVKTFRHCRVVFGVNCSPFLLNAVIDHHLTNATEEKDFEVVQKLKSSLYVDNVAASFASVENFEIFKKRSTEILAEAKFDLRLWESNVDQEIGPEPAKVLGMKWNRVHDTLYCDSALDSIDVNYITKRCILSANARVYDPLGMLAPVVMVPKKLFQDCCRLKLAWDEQVPEETQREFKKWMTSMKMIREAQISRYIGVPTPESSIHIFCDASDVGYAAVAFLRLVEDEKVSLKFLMCRSRVAPLEKVTINRLELIGCEVATRLGVTIQEALGWQHVPITYWTDSTTAKAWIFRNTDWGTFVGNRVKKIRAASTKEQWRHVPGILNPADLPSRGCHLEELLESSWWKGPSWLLEDPLCWPDAKPREDEDLIMKEAKKKTLTVVNVPVEEPWYSPKKCKFGVFRNIVKTIGWMMRFKENSLRKVQKKDVISGPLTQEELEIAEKKVYLIIQKESQIKADSFPFKVKMYEDGLYRVETRLNYGSDEEAFKCPVVIPGKHYLTELLIKEEHEKNSHAGIQFLLANLREKVWITHGRVAVKKVISRCVKCKRFSAKSLDPETAPLPKNRIRDAAPFEVTGIDFAGPLYPKGGKKIWIALFTCAVYRAVHLEVVNTLSTEGFLMALRQFIARRGRPSVVYTDNGTNFVGASNLLKNLDWKEISQDKKSSPIKWIFSPPSAPWWGGWWERLVRTMKELILRNIGKKVLELEEFRAVLCDIEATINGRPLTYVHENDNLVPLTPALFLHGPREHGNPDVDAVDRKTLLRRVKFRQEVMDNLRRRFRREYLGQLVQKRKDSKGGTLKKGEVVMIGADNVKKVLWPIGIIEELRSGRDGVTRVASVRTRNGVLERPVQRLYPLEITENEETTPAMKEAYKTRYGRTVKAPQRY